MHREKCNARRAAFLLVLILIWRLLGSPVTPAQWASLPSEGRMALTQLPLRLERALHLWLAPQETPERQVMVYDPDAQTVAAMALSEYLLGAVAAEMPASYHLEALKAQAVAVQTRLVNPGRCAAHPQARTCLDSRCCQGYLDPQARQDRWGADRAAYEGRILEALQGAANLILTYEGQPVEMLYHAVSGGRTEDAQAVFGQSLPYLVSVDSPGEEGSSRYETRTVYSCQEAAALLNAAFPQAHLQPEALSAQLAVREVSPAGRVLTIQLGDLTLSGREFRESLSLASTWFSLQWEGSTLTLVQRGYGHGVGMSQAGANAMAARGSRMADILAHYYPGTQLHDSSLPGAI